MRPIQMACRLPPKTSRHGECYSHAMSSRQGWGMAEFYERPSSLEYCTRMVPSSSVLVRLAMTAFRDMAPSPRLESGREITRFHAFIPHSERL